MTHYGFADKTDGLKSSNFQVRIVLVVNETQQKLDQFWPMSLRQLYSGNCRDYLGSKATSFDRTRAKSYERILFDLAFRIAVQAQPSIGVIRLPCNLLGWR